MVVQLLALAAVQLYTPEEILALPSAIAAMAAADASNESAGSDSWTEQQWVTDLSSGLRAIVPLLLFLILGTVPLILPLISLRDSCGLLGFVAQSLSPLFTRFPSGASVALCCSVVASVAFALFVALLVSGLGLVRVSGLGWYCLWRICGTCDSVWFSSQSIGKE